jgi:hypothetical protein
MLRDELPRNINVIFGQEHKQGSILWQHESAEVAGGNVVIDNAITNIRHTNP